VAAIDATVRAEIDFLLPLNPIATGLAAERFRLRRGRDQPAGRRGVGLLIDDEAGNPGRLVMHIDRVALAGLVDIRVERQDVETHQAVHLDPHRDAVRRDGRRNERAAREKQRGNESRHHQPTT
jgi:hypothetical protein